MNIRDNAGALFTLVVLILGIGFAVYRLIVGE